MTTIAQSLTQLASTVREHDQAAREQVTAGLDHARAAGRALIAAKEFLPHGEFERWVRDACGIEPRTARKYREIVARWAVIESKRPAGAGLLTVNEAAALAADGERQQKPPKDGAWQKALHELGDPADIVRQWWDQRAWWLIIYKVDGWLDAEIADLFKLEESAIVELWGRLTNPQIPQYPSLGGREDEFRALVERDVRFNLSLLWTEAADHARWSGFRKSTVRDIEAVAHFIGQSSPGPVLPVPGGTDWDRVAWCLVSDEMQMSLGNRPDRAPFEERWDEAVETIGAMNGATA